MLIIKYKSENKGVPQATNINTVCFEHFFKNVYRWLYLPAKSFLFPVVIVFLVWLDLDAGSTVTYLIWKPPAVTDASLRNFKVMTFPGGRGTHKNKEVTPV